MRGNSAVNSMTAGTLKWASRSDTSDSKIVGMRWYLDVGGYDDCLDDLAPPAIGHTDDGDFADVGMTGEHALDLDRVDVLAATDDAVVDPSVQRQVPLVTDRAEISSSAPTVGVDLEDVRGAQRDLADAVLVDTLDPQLGATDRTPDRTQQIGAVGGRPHMVLVAQHGDRACLGLAEDLHHARVRHRRRAQRVSVSGCIGMAPYCSTRGLASANAPSASKMSIIVGTSSAHVTPSRPARRQLSMLNQSCGTIDTPIPSTVTSIATPAV